MKLLEKQQALAVAISALIHAAFFGILAMREITPSRAGATRTVVDLTFVDSPRPARPDVAARKTSTHPLIQKSSRDSLRAVPPVGRRAQRPPIPPTPSVPEQGDDRPLNGDASLATAEHSEPPGSGDKAGKHTDSDKPFIPSIPVPGALSFTDLERLTENSDRTNEDAKRYQKQKEDARRNRGAFISNDARVRAAMANRRSATSGARVLPLGRNKTDAQAYLLKIHQKLEPLFSRFLTALDSPSEQLHKKVQTSFLKYNPFYVSPPDSERQDTLRGPMSDLSMKTKTEFEILPTGALGEVRMLSSSRSQAFDAAAVDTVFKGAPFVPPPAVLLSMSDRAYVQWTFCRDWKQNTPAKGRLLIIAPLLSDTDSETEDGASAPDTSSP